MPKPDYRRYSVAQRKHCRARLMTTLRHFGLSQGGQRLLLDLLMESETTMLGRRLEIARRLLLGWQFQSIVEELHVGLSTTSRRPIHSTHEVSTYSSVK